MNKNNKIIIKFKKASLETFFGMGLIFGPMVGGALYSVDGYYLPFVSLGVALFVTALLTACILPKHPNEPESSQVKRKLIDFDFIYILFIHYFSSTASILNVLRIPGVLLCALGICSTSTSIGFISATLEPHLRQFSLGPVLLGMSMIYK